MIFEMPEGGYLLLEEQVERSLSPYLGAFERRLEAGGILIGSYRGPHVHIRTCTVPLVADVRRPTLFDRKDAGHQCAALRAWRRSGGTETFVGEWHTHPEPNPGPSPLDRETWAGVLRKSAQPLVFLIIGWQSLWCGLGEPSGVRPLHARDVDPSDRFT